MNYDRDDLLTAHCLLIFEQDLRRQTARRETLRAITSAIGGCLAALCLAVWFGGME